MVGEIRYSYAPRDWDQERFLGLGGFVVVFLNYNKVKFIGESVASALNQDYPLLEMFFMDDASTDGSGDIMERLVREYRGRHKVTVVWNSENQNITGQWNIVSKLATGYWYGMFCADDIAHKDRVSVVSRRIAQYPSLRGLCTAVNAIDVFTREKKTFGVCADVVQSGKVSLEPLCRQNPPIIGATAWWHRDLFKERLPKGPLDDVILRWILQCKYDGFEDAVWMWVGESKTIDYSLGCGVSSPGRDGRVPTNRVDEWLSCKARIRSFAEISFKTWVGLKEYYLRIGAKGKYLSIADSMQCYYACVTGNTVKRICQFPKIISLILDRANDNGVVLMAVRTWIKLLIQEFFGCRFAAIVSCYIIHRNNSREFA